MLEADHIVDIGPKAGRKGGEVVFSGTPDEMLSTETLTAQYLNGKMKIPVRETPRKGTGKRFVINVPCSPYLARSFIDHIQLHYHSRK